MKIFRSSSSRETKSFASKLARSLIGCGRNAKFSIVAKKATIKRARHGAVVIALTGELGSGKTTFVQGFLRGLGVRRGGASPTFILMRRHALRRKRFQNVYHIDAYRVRKANDFLKLELAEILAEPRNIVLIEWAEKLRGLLPEGACWIRFLHGKGENERE